MPRRFKFLDTAAKRLGINSSLILDYNLEIAAHRNMSEHMRGRYGGELRRVCHSDTTMDSSAFGIYKIGGNSMIAVTDNNRYQAPRVSIRNRKSKSRLRRQPKQRFPSNQKKAGIRKKRGIPRGGDDDASDADGDDE